MKLVDLIFKKKNKQRLTKNSNSKYPACTLNDIVNETHPKLTPITQEEIDDIHARGKITQEEKIKEWEKLDLCAPGDNIGSSSWCCRKYHYDCHDCLVAYSSKKKEFYPSLDNLKIVNSPLPKQEANSKLQESTPCKKRILKKS